MSGLSRNFCQPNALSPGADKLVAILSDVGARLAKLDRPNASRCRGASAPSVRSTRRAGRPRGDGGRIRYDNTICTVSGCWGQIQSKRTNFGIPNEINAVRFSCRSDRNDPPLPAKSRRGYGSLRFIICGGLCARAWRYFLAASPCAPPRRGYREKQQPCSIEARSPQQRSWGLCASPAATRGPGTTRSIPTSAASGARSAALADLTSASLPVADNRLR